MTDGLAKQFPQGLDGARGLARGVGRLLGDMGYATLPEFSLRNNRRADVAGLDAKGRFMNVEIKSSTADFRADQKWPEYLEFCDAFYFAVAQDFPRSILPNNQGLMIVDRFGGAIVRQADVRPMNPARRKALTVRFARKAASRLGALVDPSVSDRGLGG